ncbi:MAG: hypothetical protein H6541_01445 [Lentimicrobiaceae bacterium]|nr:hypothetical protein [Lentimicrobiaceae bacterium]MCB9023072.1 hypothetical protein [Lentimicrobiaceae bacterium]MCO5264596.1 SxtJ family membrane protein [Lentimicrobium sp.]HPG33989.1 SxtJ family membrane protein [Lentimicrobium sp.]
MSKSKNGSIKAFAANITKEQSKDTGLAMMLILLLAGFLTGNILFYKLSLPVLLVVMIFPGWFYPLAIVWFGFSHLLGTFMSQLILSVVFTFIVVPVALVRRAFGYDSLKLRQFKKGTGTVMKIRNHLFAASDIEKPY